LGETALIPGLLKEGGSLSPGRTILNKYGWNAVEKIKAIAGRFMLAFF
jgi:hypothetical protein